jgi:tripartite-type tricarboxylate transporter receptor subunit TctC
MIRIVVFALFAAASLVTVGSAQESYPTRPITIVASFPPGGISDITGRPLAATLEKVLKNPVVLVNKSGAAGAVGNQFVATAKPDGYTLLLGIVSISFHPAKDQLFGQPPTYTLDQFTGVARLSAEPSIIAVSAETPWKTIKELVDDAKKRPGQITFSSSGLYGASHVPTEMFLQAAGITMRHLPTTGGGPMVTAVLGNHAQLTTAPTTLVGGHSKAGKMRLLAHTGTGRLPAFPDVPSLAELGYDVSYHAWTGLIAPKATPPHVIKILREAVKQAVQEPEFKNALAKADTPIAYQDADEFNAWWARDAGVMAAVVKKIGKVGN